MWYQDPVGQDPVVWCQDPVARLSEAVSQHVADEAKAKAQVEAALTRAEAAEAELRSTHALLNASNTAAANAEAQLKATSLELQMAQAAVQATKETVDRQAADAAAAAELTAQLSPVLQSALEAQGYSVFVGESDIEGGASWVQAIDVAITDCQVFIPVCSKTYGDTKWTLRGDYPPKPVRMYLSHVQRLPRGNQRLVQADFQSLVSDLVAAIKKAGCLPRNAQSSFLLGAGASSRGTGLLAMAGGRAAQEAGQGSPVLGRGPQGRPVKAMVGKSRGVKANRVSLQKAREVVAQLRAAKAEANAQAVATVTVAEG
ncbi:hypothetical protein V8C86DRAFT_3136097 [Haematococcus lacustris]